MGSEDREKFLEELDAVVHPIRDKAVSHKLLEELIAGRLPVAKVRNFLAQFYYRIKDVPNRRMAIAQIIPEFTHEQIEAKKLGVQIALEEVGHHKLFLKACEPLGIDVDALLEGKYLRYETQRELSWQEWLLEHGTPVEPAATIVYAYPVTCVRLFPRMRDGLMKHYELSEADTEYFHMHGPVEAHQVEMGRKIVGLLAVSEEDKRKAIERATVALEQFIWWAGRVYDAPGIEGEQDRSSRVVEISPPSAT